jgi:hypothetical protein
MESKMKQRTTLERAGSQYNLLPHSTIQINLPNGDKLWLIQSAEDAGVTFVSLDIFSESNLETTKHDNKEYENYSTESVSVDSNKNGRLQTYFNVTSFLHPSVIIEADSDEYNTMQEDEKIVYEDEHICEHGNSRASNCSDCDDVSLEDPEITGEYVPDLDELIAEDEKFIEGIE